MKGSGREEEGDGGQRGRQVVGKNVGRVGVSGGRRYGLRREAWCVRVYGVRL